MMWSFPTGWNVVWNKQHSALSIDRVWELTNSRAVLPVQIVQPIAAQYSAPMWRRANVSFGFNDWEKDGIEIKWTFQGLSVINMHKTLLQKLAAKHFLKGKIIIKPSRFWCLDTFEDKMTELSFNGGCFGQTTIYSLAENSRWKKDLEEATLHWPTGNLGHHPLRWCYKHGH